MHTYTRCLEIADQLLKYDESKCVLVLHGRVYDVTTFLDQHPGGHYMLLDASGTDASATWDEFRHSKSAKNLLKEYLVADTATTTCTSDKKQKYWRKKYYKSI